MSKRTGSSRHAGKIWRNCGAFAPYFFGYGATVARLLRIFFGYGADTARLLRIFLDMAQMWRVCSVFFWLAYALNQTRSFAVALYRPTMVCS